VREREETLLKTFLSLFRSKYRTVEALTDITLSIEEGELVGILGPNGAGKTTFIKLLVGLLYPTRGEVKVLGHIPFLREKAFLKKITFVAGQKEQMLWDLPPYDAFLYQKAIYNIPTDRFEKNLKYLVSLLSAEEILNKPVRRLSLGERMKGEIICALLHEPSILFLDEPTLGLDIPSQQTIREFIQKYREEHGATILITSHNWMDLRVCSRLLLFHSGHLLYDGSMEQWVENLLPRKRVVIQFSQKVETIPVPSGGEVVERSPYHWVLEMEKETIPSFLREILSTGLVKDIRVENPPIERVIGEIFSTGTLS